MIVVGDYLILSQNDRDMTDILRQMEEEEAEAGFLLHISYIDHSLILDNMSMVRNMADIHSKIYFRL